MKTKEWELYSDMERHLMNDVLPSKYFLALDDSKLTVYPFNMFGNLKKTEQSPKFHPEGTVWNHTMLVIDEAAKRKEESSDSRAFMWAALLHDIGKPGSTKVRNGKITSYDHDRLGAKMAGEFLSQFEEDNAFIKKVAALIRFHMHILYVVRSLPFADIKSMKKQISVDDVALLGLCDRLGRVGADTQKEEEAISLFLEKCKANI